MLLTLLFKDFIVIPTVTIATCTALAHAYCRAPRMGVSTLESFGLYDWLLMIAAGLLVVILMLSSMAHRQAKTRGHRRMRTCDGPSPIAPRPRRPKAVRKPRIPRVRGRGRKNPA